MQKVLILGRGALPLLAGIFAEKRGYEAIVVYEEEVPRFPAILGGLPGLPLNYFFDHVGFPLEDPRFFHATSPSLLFFGEKWQLLGVPELRSGFSEQERDRWMPGFVSLQETLLPDIFGVLKKEFATSIVPGNLFRNWFSWWTDRRSDRKESRTAKKAFQRVPEVGYWSEFLDALSPYLGLDSRDESVPLLRALVSCLNAWVNIPEADILHREAQKSASKGLKGSIRAWDGTPVSLEFEKRRKSLSVSFGGTTETVDRIVDLSGTLDRSLNLALWEWSIPEGRLSNVWPLQFLIPGSLGKSGSGLFQGRSRDGQIRFFAILHGPDGGEHVGSPRELLDPLVLGEEPLPGTPKLHHEPRPMIDYTGIGPGPTWKVHSSYQSSSGPVRRLLDPTRLPYLTEDWMRLLYRQFPMI